MDLKKNPSKNVEKRKFNLRLLGLLFACSAVLVAFEWRVIELKTYDSYSALSDDYIPEEIVPVSRIKSPPPPPPPKPIVEKFKVVKKIEPTVDPAVPVEPVVDPEPVIIDIAPPTETVEEPPLVWNATVMPEFKGGDVGMFQYLADNIRYPQRAKEAGIEGKVYVSFVVDENGQVVDVEILRGIGGGCDEEAIRVLKNMPVWKAGSNNGMPVKVNFKMPIRFTLN